MASITVVAAPIENEWEHVFANILMCDLCVFITADTSQAKIYVWKTENKDKNGIINTAYSRNRRIINVLLKKSLYVTAAFHLNTALV